MAEKSEARRFLENRQTAYRIVFGAETPDIVAVMTDLRKFCRADATTFHADARLHAMLEGRREVYLRIQQHLKLSTDELIVLLGGE